MQRASRVQREISPQQGPPELRGRRWRAKIAGIADLLRRLGEHGIDFKDLQTSESSLEDIFVSLVRGRT